MRRPALFSLVLVFGLFIALMVMPVHPIQAAGGIYYVDDDNCPGPGTGTPVDAFCKIQDGIDAASSGDTVQVAAGTYYENITMKSGVLIQGAGQGISIIDGGGSGRVVTAASVDSTATLDGFTITNGVSAVGGGIYNDLSSSSTVTNCILWGGSPEEINDLFPKFSVTYSDIQGGYTGTGNINADPMFLDPDGLDNIPGTDDDDLHLKSGSPCIDTGTATGAPDTDIEGKQRPLGKGYNMGAYEFQRTAMPWIPLLLLDD